LQAFPGALSNAELVAKTVNALEKYGYGKTTLLATSFCCDEVNRPLEEDFAKPYGQQFNMVSEIVIIETFFLNMAESQLTFSSFQGGLAGFPFGGVTGFAAMAKHIPDGGSCKLDTFFCYLLHRVVQVCSDRYMANTCSIIFMPNMYFFAPLQVLLFTVLTLALTTMEMLVPSTAEARRRVEPAAVVPWRRLVM
jgi:Limiting CO2-inducible proteins B/C beta carbonyic anhydrases